MKLEGKGRKIEKKEENFDKWLCYYALIMRLERKNKLESYSQN